MINGKERQEIIDTLITYLKVCGWVEAEDFDHLGAVANFIIEDRQKTITKYKDSIHIASDGEDSISE